MARVYLEGPETPLGVNEGTCWFDTAAMLWRRFQSGSGWAPIADLNASRVKWAEAELQILRDHYAAEGAEGCAARLQGREPIGIKMRAFKLGLKGPRPHNSLVKRLTLEQVEQIVQLHDVEKLGFRVIAERFDVCESTASNAYYAVMCRRRGYRPAERDENGHLLPGEIERLRAFLRKGTKPVDIQLYMGISAGAISNERRQYNAELKARGKRLLPPPGAGERYSGARIDRETKRRVEQLYLEGKATPKVSALTGVSRTHCLRTREKLVRRLKRQRKSLPDCDINGRRLHYETIAAIPDEKRQTLRAALLERTPVRRAAIVNGIGLSSAYKIRDELKAELEAEGKELPTPILPGRSNQPKPWLPPQRRWWIFYRQLEGKHGHDEAKRLIVGAIDTIGQLAAAIHRLVLDARRRRPLTFEEQLALVRDGRGLVAKPQFRRADPSFTLGGVATGAL